MAADVDRNRGLVADRELAEIAQPATLGADDDAGRSIIFVGVRRIIGLIRSRYE